LHIATLLDGLNIELFLGPQSSKNISLYSIIKASETNISIMMKHMGQIKLKVCGIATQWLAKMRVVYQWLEKNAKLWDWVLIELEKFILPVKFKAPIGTEKHRRAKNILVDSKDFIFVKISRFQGKGIL